MKVLVRSPVSQMSGYGRDGIGLSLALLDRGHDVRLVPYRLEVPLPREIAGLLTLPIDPPFDLAIHHMPAEKARLPLSDAICSRYNAVWTMWGWPELPEQKWVGTLAERYQYFDAVVCYESVTAETFEPYVGADRIKVVLGGYTADDWGPPEETIPPHRFRFGMNGKLGVRKGVYLAIPAFLTCREQHPDFDAELEIRTVEPIFPPQVELDERVKVLVSRARPEELRPWYHSLDTLLAPSMSECKHLPPIEALTCGVPVIASDIPGHRLWASEDMVTYLPTKPYRIEPGFTGDAVDVQDLADAMWLHYTTPAQQRLKAAVAARTLPAMLDWSKVIERFGNAIGMRL